jgi:hypothetical protein
MKRSTILKSKTFWLYRKPGRLFVRCLAPHSYPRTIRLADCYEARLKACGKDWGVAAILELGCGLYAGPIKRNLYS